MTWLTSFNFTLEKLHIVTVCQKNLSLLSFTSFFFKQRQENDSICKLFCRGFSKDTAQLLPFDTESYATLKREKLHSCGPTLVVVAFEI